MCYAAVAPFVRSRVIREYDKNHGCLISVREWIASATDGSFYANLVKLRDLTANHRKSIVNIWLRLTAVYTI